MKKLLYLLMVAMFAITLPSCGGDDDEPDAKIKVTQSEIQGTWHYTAYGTYHRIKFDSNEYSYSQMDTKTSNILYMENGTYTISGYDITFTARLVTSKLGECEIYWEDANKTELHIYPMGTYVKSN